MTKKPRRRLAAALFLPLLLVGASCTAAGDETTASDEEATAVTVGGDGMARGVEQSDAAQPDPGSVDDSAAGGAAETGSGSLADLITELPAAPTGLPEPGPEAPRPIGLSIEALGVEVATVIDVGVEPNGDMEIPPADEVGWYRYGPSPGQVGSAVLAAHIADDGQDGVFVQLDGLELGSTIRIDYDDGTTGEFIAVSKEQYDKAEIPRDEIFDRAGPPRLVLITCGGDFNRNLRSYDDNIIVYAEAA